MLIVLFAASCGDDDDSGNENTQVGQASETTVTIWAQPDIQRPLDSMIKQYEQRHPEHDIQVEYAPNRDIEDRLFKGERPDLIVSTTRKVANLAEEGTIPSEHLTFGEDVWQLVVAPGNPKGIQSLDVFGNDPTTTSGLCRQEVACGSVARRVLGQARINPTPDSTEPDAKTLIAKVAEGQLDVGFVSRSQAVKAVRDGRVTTVDLPTQYRASDEFRIAIIRNGGAVDSFLDFFRAHGQVRKILENTGLRPPSSSTTTTTPG